MRASERARSHNAHEVFDLTITSAKLSLFSFFYNTQKKMKRRKVAAKQQKAKPLPPSHVLGIPKDVWLTCIFERHCSPLTMLHAKRICKLFHAWLDDTFVERVLVSVYGLRLTYKDDKPWMKLVALDAIERCKNSTRRIWVCEHYEVRPYRFYNLGDMQNHLNWDYEQVVWHFKNGWILRNCY